MNAPIARWGLSFSAALLAMMLAVALAQILSRALFNHTLDWAEETARMALVWSALLAAPMGYRAAGHVAITAFIEGLPPRVLYVTGVVVNLLVGWICLEFLLESIAFVARGDTIVSTGLGIRMSFIYAVVPLSLAALLLVSIEACLRLLRALISGERELLVGVVPVMHEDKDV
ncbi:MAG: TRAP transporter small permease subunit [Gammaproteobacteria bacterium]|nr:TRAP transporter small permease subunit [Gammaproteobacteria bacterium]